MIVPPVVDTDGAASEETLQVLEDRCAPGFLDDRELGLHLPAESTRSIPEDRNAEASLAVDEADDPLRCCWPFLLIVRTGHIVTTQRRTPYGEGVTPKAVAPDARGFQHLASCTCRITP